MKPQRFFSFLIVLFLSAGSSAVAQEDSKPSRTASPVSYEDRNFVRWNAYLVARGAFAVGYERALADKHAVTIDAGLTYRDFVYEAKHDGLFDDSDVDVRVGHYLELAYKFYPNDYEDFDDAIYISPGFITRGYNITRDVEYYNGNDYSTQPVDVGYNMTEAFLRFGHVRESWVLDGVFYDLYFGFGYRLITSNSYELTNSQIGPGEEIVSQHETKGVPAVYLGVKLGFTF
jgi:hypothetical protein